MHRYSILVAACNETGLFDRAWARSKPHVESIVGAWLDGRLEWNDMIAKLAAAV